MQRLVKAQRQQKAVSSSPSKGTPFFPFRVFSSYCFFFFSQVFITFRYKHNNCKIQYCAFKKLFAEPKRLASCHSVLQILKNHMVVIIRSFELLVDIAFLSGGRFRTRIKTIKAYMLQVLYKCDKMTQEKGLTIWSPVADFRSILRYCRFVTYHFTVKQAYAIIY